jgi:hypothetical protein
LADMKYLVQFKMISETVDIAQLGIKHVDYSKYTSRSFNNYHIITYLSRTCSDLRLDTGKRM